MNNIDVFQCAKWPNYKEWIQHIKKHIQKCFSEIPLETCF